MRLLVQHGGAWVPVVLAAGETVAAIKARAESALGVPVAEQRLVFGGCELADGLAFADCVLRDGSTVQLLRRCAGGSAAARANAAMKRKRERQEMKQMLKDASSSDEEIEGMEEYPPCVGKMGDELKALMKKQMEEFMELLQLAIADPGENQERLEGLTSDFNKLLYSGFIHHKGFYPVDHKHRPPPLSDSATRKRLLGEQQQEPEGATGLMGNLRKLKDHPWFKNFIVGAILVAGINVGINTYLDCGKDADGREYQSCYADTLGGTLYAQAQKPGSWDKETCAAEKGCWEMPSHRAVENTTGVCWERGPMPECFAGQTAGDISATLETIDFIILLIFTFECLLKIACEGAKPWLFCKDMWNVFDLLIVIMCYMPAGGDVAVLRLLRLARLLKLLHAVEDLQVILSGLTAGFNSIGYILVLLVLVFYLFAIVANMLFAENDPVEFKDLDTAMITLFRMSTMEDWTDVMYINMYGCAAYGYGSFCFDADYCAKYGDPKLTCTPESSHAGGYSAAVFFITFVVISGYVVMSLFIGVITTSMATETDKHAESKKIKKQTRSKLEVIELIEERRRDGIVVRPSVDLQRDDSSQTHFPVGLGAIGRLADSGVARRYLAVGDRCQRLVSSSRFQNIITGCILVAAVLIGCQTYDSMVDWVGPEMDMLDALILFVFTLEIVLKVIACGMRPWTFFFDPWNSFDFIVVFFCLMPIPGDSGDSVAVLRLLRLLRVLKLFKTFPQLQIIMTGLAKGMSSIGYIALLQTLLMYVFGIIAIMFYRANDPIHFGSLAVTFVTLFRASTFEDWTDVMFIAMYGCKQWSYGEFDYRCENNEKGGLRAAAFFILFILLSALIMLNLVIGSICSSMADAQEAYEIVAQRREQVQRIVNKTALRGRDYNLPGVSEDVIDAWIEAFEKMDSAASALSLEASIHKDDINVLLELVGEVGTLRARSIEELLIRANHTVPIGLVDMMGFVEALAQDLMSDRIKVLSERTAWVFIGKCNGLALEDDDDLDPYCVLIVNGQEIGRTHTLGHTGSEPEWNERLGVPIELLRPTTNSFKIEVMNDVLGFDDLLATAKISVEGGRRLPGMAEPTDYPLELNTSGADSKKIQSTGKPSIHLSMIGPKHSFQGAAHSITLEHRAQQAIANLVRNKRNRASPASDSAGNENGDSTGRDFVNPTAEGYDSDDPGLVDDT